MADLVTDDDVRFAAVRARWLDSPEQVATELLDAAADPDRLDGVSTLEARSVAGGVLFEGGQPDRAISILRGVVVDSRPGADYDARTTLAMALAETGDPAEAESVANESIQADPPGIATRTFVARAMVRGGHCERAQRMADEAVSAAATGPHRGVVKRVDISMATAARDKIYEEVQLVQQGRLAPGQDEWRIGPVRHFDEPPWPSIIGGVLLWWPEAEYRRVARQVPGLVQVLGDTWPAHTVRVEEKLRSATLVSARRLCLAAADFSEFTTFVSVENADPRTGSTMTAYTTFASRDPLLRRIHLASEASATAPVRWPPRHRQPCWCGSGRRYQGCHADSHN